jgi:hypothetical protein
VSAENKQQVSDPAEPSAGDVIATLTYLTWHQSADISKRAEEMLDWLQGVESATPTAQAGELPPMPTPVTTYYDDIDQVEVLCYSQNQMTAYGQACAQAAIAGSALPRQALTDAEITRIAKVEGDETDLGFVFNKDGRHSAVSFARAIEQHITGGQS